MGDEVDNSILAFERLDERSPSEVTGESLDVRWEGRFGRWATEHRDVEGARYEEGFYDWRSQSPRTLTPKVNL